MDTKWVNLLVFCFALLILPRQAEAQSIERAFCIQPPHDQICPTFPQDQTDFSRFLEYRVVNDTAQAPFDQYAWQAFVALNWTDLRRGAAAVSWRDFVRKQSVLGTGLGPCSGLADDRSIVVGTAHQSDGTQLIDQHGNFVVYETRLNAAAERYLRDNRLTTVAGRASFQGQIDFPRGNLMGQAAPALLKLAWQISPETAPEMITARGVIPVPAEQSADGQARCLNLRLGLIGMHIVTKVESGHGDKWIWSTFEHRSNVPTAANARAINSIYAHDLFPDGCAAPNDLADKNYLLFDPGCPDCPRNTPPQDDLFWAAEAPFAVTSHGLPTAPSQIVRCWKVFRPTQDTNRAWQARLAQTLLGEYQLISSQWRGANPDPFFPNGELPRYLSNIAMETYIQTDPQGTCLGCHVAARTAEGAPSDFTFLLR